MKQLILILLGMALFFPFQQEAHSQEVLKGAYVKEHTPQRIPVPYQYLREADVMWSKTVWRRINLREKRNHHLYYPEVPIGARRKSLIDLLLWAIDQGAISAYKASPTQFNEFKEIIGVKEIYEKFEVKDEVQTITDPETGDKKTVTIKGELRTSKVKEYLVKEVWFFDKQRSLMEVRIIGICPIFFDNKGGAVRQKMLFWVYFPELRPVLASHEVFNNYNDAERRSYDDIFFKRYFSSYIVKESNVFNDRNVNEYTEGIETLLEANRIKEDIFKFEHDMWEY